MTGYPSGAGAQTGARRHRAGGLPANLGAEVYYWPDTITLSGSDVVTWDNQGTAGSDLDLDAATGTVTFDTDHLVFDGSSHLATAIDATALAMSDGQDLDVLLVCRPNVAGQLMATFGSVLHWRVAPRTGGATQWLMHDGTVFTRSLGKNMSSGSLYCVRGHIAGAASPSNDEATMRVSDTDYAVSTADNCGTIPWDDPLLLGNIAGAAFTGDVYAAAAKIGGFSSSELSELTSRVNTLTGLSLTSV